MLSCALLLGIGKSEGTEQDKDAKSEQFTGDKNSFTIYQMDVTLLLGPG
jgi:hypothetical protein